MKTVNLEQGSEEWLQWRRSHICASDLPIIMGDSLWCTPQLLWARKLGLADEQPINSAMQRGKDLEPLVRNIVNTECNSSFRPLVIEHDLCSWAGASLDGYDEEQDAIEEIKCINRKDHELSLRTSIVPAKYMAQVHWCLYVSGCKFCQYVSWRDKDNWHKFHVERDEEYIDTLIEKALRFWNYLQSGEEPI